MSKVLKDNIEMAFILVSTFTLALTGYNTYQLIILDSELSLETKDEHGRYHENKKIFSYSDEDKRRILDLNLCLKK